MANDDKLAHLGRKGSKRPHRRVDQAAHLALPVLWAGHGGPYARGSGGEARSCDVAVGAGGNPTATLCPWQSVRTSRDR